MSREHYCVETKSLSHLDSDGAAFQISERPQTDAKNPQSDGICACIAVVSAAMSEQNTPAWKQYLCARTMDQSAFPWSNFLNVFDRGLCWTKHKPKNTSRKIQPHLIRLLQHHTSPFQPEIKRDTSPLQSSLDGKQITWSGLTPNLVPRLLKDLLTPANRSEPKFDFRRK